MLSEHYINKRIRQNLARQIGRHIPFRNAMILTDLHYPVDKAFLKKLSQITGIPYERMDVLYISDKEVHPDWVTVLKEHLSWNGKIRDPNIRRYFEKNYDLLIDLSTLDKPKKKLISSGIQAGFRTGISPEPDFYDLIIRCPGRPEHFLDELKKYLEAMKFVP